MALDDWYEVIHHMIGDGTAFINVYHVLRDNVGVDAQDVAEAYNDSILPDYATIQYTGISNTEITARNLEVETDFFSRTPSVPLGLRAGANFAHFNAVGVQFNRTRNDMRNGQKRFVGGVEADTNGAIWLAPLLSDVGDLVTALLAPWELGGAPGVTVCEYGILQRICRSTPSPPCVDGYRLPETDGEVKFFLPVTATVRDTVRSQVSRKRLV